jgi:hypothetical protein
MIEELVNPLFMVEEPSVFDPVKDIERETAAMF